MVSRRGLLSSVAAGSVVCTAGCLGELAPPDEPPTVTIRSSLNDDGETYSVTVSGAANRADYIKIEHDEIFVHSIRGEVDDGVEIADDAEMGEVTKATAAIGEQRIPLTQEAVGSTDRS